MAESVEQRLERLEREVDRLRAGVVDVSEIRLVDEGGRVRFSLSARGGAPALTLCDERGEARAKIELSASGPGITLADEQGQTRAWLGFANEALRIGFADERGNSRAFFGVMKKSGPTARFYDEAGGLVWSAPH